MPKSKERVSVFTKKYEETYTLKDIRDGDVFIVQHDSKVQNAGVYSDGQIVQLNDLSPVHPQHTLRDIVESMPRQVMAVLGKGGSTQPSAGTFATAVNKVNVETFTLERTEENRVTVYRKKGGIPRTFKENVDEAMSKCPESNYTHYNCIEFVMELLEVYLQPTASDCYKIASGAKPKGFKVVKNFSDDYSGNAKLGDLFLVESGLLGYSLHAGVFCSVKDQEIIQFSSGAVNRVHINGFSRGKKFTIYRKKTGVSSKIQKTMNKAMSSMPEYSESDKNKSVRFALELLYGEVEKTERDVEGLTQLVFGDNSADL
ncbi:uncharacterized protein LOC131370624 isoform X1 [Hemibagrus wyckioides]|uniref:uncharacterized protein LOC131370624 isoform X1 n=1 Tax=Hemibagrus wyckioides TaxID=337641 RepID=UPI00266D7357|nr:uncharacterized protein LOC131370624 isoform X1 [Hemibagrus wyckioides]